MPWDAASTNDPDYSQYLAGEHPMNHYDGYGARELLCCSIVAQAQLMIYRHDPPTGKS